jgi:hypothetical protein
MMLSGAPWQDAAKQDDDQGFLCMMCLFTRPVDSDRSRRAGAPFSGFTSAGMAAFGG